MLGRRGQARRVQRHDPAARGPRREGHLDGVLRARGHAGDLARSDAAQGDRAVPRRRVLGRPRLPAVRPAAGHRRREHLARLVHPGRVDGRRDDAAGRRAHGRRSAPARWPSARTCGRSASSRTCRGSSARIAASASCCSAKAAASSRPTRSACRCSRRCRCCPRCGWAATAGVPIVVSDPASPAAVALREAADAVRKAAKTQDRQAAHRDGALSAVVPGRRRFAVRARRASVGSSAAAGSSARAAS